MVTPKVFCEINEKNEKEMDTFYLVVSNKDDRIWLFTQGHRNGVYNYFRKPRTISEATDYSKALKDGGLKRTMDKIPKHIKYIEKEYEISVYSKSRRRK